jgi:hypothetical protein
MTDVPVVPGDPGEAAGDGDRESMDLVAAALRADAADIDTLIRVLSVSLTEMLPAGMVAVQRTRSVSDRISGRDGTPVTITVTSPELRLGLTHPKHRNAAVKAELQRVVRGVVIARQEVTVEEWIAALAKVLTDIAARNSVARQALSRLLGG